jgi:hypothetical protein
MLVLDGRTHRLGGLLRGRAQVAESVAGCEVELAGAAGLLVTLRAEVPAGTAAGWRYADPQGGSHEVVNCSISALELGVRERTGSPIRTLSSSHGGAYELGMAEGDHGIPIAPFDDG